MADLAERMCEACGKPFTPTRKDARFCGGTCQRRGARSAPKRQRPTALVTRVRADLKQAGRLASYEGELAVELARQITAPGATGVVQLSRELRALMAALTAVAGEGLSGPASAEPEDALAKARADRERIAGQAAAGSS